MTGQLQGKRDEIYLLGKDTSIYEKEVYQRIGIMLDTGAFYERLSGYMNLKIFASIHGIHESVIMDILKSVGLEDSATKPVSKFSTGMKQRLSLARAIIHEPDVVFLDEPTSGLDPLTSELIHKLIIELKNNGTTIFLTTHNMEEATLLCDEIGLLYQGKLVENDTPEVIKQRYWNDDNVKLKFIAEPEKILSIRKDYDEIILLLKKENVSSVHSMEPSLEEVFKKVVRGDNK